MSDDEEHELLEKYNSEFNEAANKIENDPSKFKYLCLECNGSGERYISPIYDCYCIDKKCTTCNGEKYTKKIMKEISHIRTCRMCNGYGEMKTLYHTGHNAPTFHYLGKCSYCDGNGTVQEREFI